MFWPFLFFPMWLEIAECPKNESPENYLNQMKSQIKSVLLEDICSENKMIFIKCQIQLADASAECRKLERKLKIAEYLASEHSDNENLQIEKIIRQIPDGSAFNMPANLRIFELGTAKFQGFCWHVEKRLGKAEKLKNQPGRTLNFLSCPILSIISVKFFLYFFSYDAAWNIQSFNDIFH